MLLGSRTYTDFTSQAARFRFYLKVWSDILKESYANMEVVNNYLQALSHKKTVSVDR